MIYLSYGSNLHPERLKERAPSARLLGVAKLSCFALVFAKRSRKDGSGKCHIRSTGNPENFVYVAVYEIGGKEKERLDCEEGLHFGYHEESFTIVLNGQNVCGTAYVADDSYIDLQLKPMDWYREMVVLGAQFLNLPKDYIQNIRRQDAIKDKRLEAKIEWCTIQRLVAANKRVEKDRSSTQLP